MGSISLRVCLLVEIGIHISIRILHAECLDFYPKKVHSHKQKPGTPQLEAPGLYLYIQSTTNRVTSIYIKDCELLRNTKAYSKTEYGNSPLITTASPQQRWLPRPLKNSEYVDTEPA